MKRNPFDYEDRPESYIFIMLMHGNKLSDWQVAYALGTTTEEFDKKIETSNFSMKDFINLMSLIIPKDNKVFTDIYKKAEERRSWLYDDKRNGKWTH